jgi:hypothetical protein
VLPPLASWERTDASLRRADQLAPLKQGPPANESVPPVGQTAGVRPWTNLSWTHMKERGPYILYDPKTKRWDVLEKLVPLTTLSENPLDPVEQGKPINYDNEHPSHVPFRTVNGTDPMPGFIQSLK